MEIQNYVRMRKKGASPMDLLLEVEKAIREQRLAEAGDRIVAAVSGGPDSMAMLHVLFLLADKLMIGLVVAHLNHGFRGAESEREAETVAAYAAKLGLPCEIGRIDMPAIIAETGMNAQAAARDRRYAFLHDTALRYGAGKIALAHHADDQAETVLMRFLRGTGPSGLAGIPVRRTEKKVELIRPLLRIYKSELERHCAEHGIPVCYDSSNGKRDYFRNEVRLDIVPFLRRYNDKLPETLNRLADLMRAEDEWMEAETARLFAELVRVERDGRSTACSLSANRFAVLHVALQRRLIKLILNYVFSGADLSDFTRIETIRAAILRQRGESLRLDLHDGLKLFREYDTVRFAAADSEAVPYVYGIDSTDTVLRIPEAGMELEVRLIEGAEAALLLQKWNIRRRDEAFFDFDHVSFPLTVRSRLPGDRMVPLGLKGTKKVKDMFIDEKVPLAERRRIPHVADAAGRILWIPGLRRSGHALVSEQTSRVLAMKVRSIRG